MIGTKERAANKGSILVEAVFGIVPFTLLLFLSIELFRAGYLHVLLQQSAFVYTRDRALGKTERESRKDVYEFLDEALGRVVGGDMRRDLDFESKLLGRTVEGKVHLRYPMLIKFEMVTGDRFKHHMEITKSCQFPG